MSMGVKYKGGFYSYKDVLYEIEILQEGYSGSATTVGFTDTPLLIEWDEVDKLEPVMSSSAKLQLFSDSDRQFVSLYTVKAGSIRLDVYREGVFYWSGTLDTELYEEPFAYGDSYGVELTFADFAVLDRLNYNGSGFKSLRTLVTEALNSSSIRYNASYSERISTTKAGSTSGSLLDEVFVQCQNFTDEDGDPYTVREVLDEVLRPFALRLVQKSGKIHVHDLNALYASYTPSAVVWDSDDSTFSVDSVYNNVTLTFSPYERTTLLEGKVEEESVSSSSRLTTWFNTATESSDEVGFYTYLSTTGKGLTVNSPAKFYRIDPVYSGESEAGVAWTVETFSSRNSGTYVNYLNEPGSSIGSLLFSVPDRPYLANIGSDRSNYKLKISLKVLFDPRYNPFEESANENEKGNYEEQQHRANFAYIPIKLTLRGEDGAAKYHLVNKGVKDSTSYASFGNLVYWSSGEASWGDAWLCWYNDDRKKASGLTGWSTNKQLIGYYRGDLPKIFGELGEGDLVRLPDTHGYLDLQVGTGVVLWDYQKEVKAKNYTQCRWLLYKEPKIEFVKKSGKSIDTKDIVYKAWLNKDAQEGVSIETILGCMPQPSPAALGLLFDSYRTAYTSFTRAGVTACIEKLLIGTVYTQYATPHVMLSGTTGILSSFGTYTDVHAPGRYVLLSEVQDLRNDSSEIKMVQFEADSYEGIEYEG